MTRSLARCLGLALVLAGAATLLGPGAAQLEARPHDAVRSSLPLVVIQTSGPVRNAPKTSARLRFIRNDGRENVSTERGTDFDGPVGIEIRGHSSRRFPKLSYSFETRDAAGKARNVSLAGLPSENDWILYASYNDKTLMRNALAAWTARTMGRYASRTRFVEVVLNGRYHGVYVLMERVKRDPRRVRLDDRDITGGYLLEGTVEARVRDTNPSAFFRAAVTGKPFRYHDPRPKQLGARRAAWIRDYVGAFERSLYGGEFRHATAGYRRYLDVSSAVDYVLVNELFKNQDAFQTSMFLSKSAGRRLVLGPVWDFDVSLGNSNYQPSASVNGWVLHGRTWGWRLLADPAFVTALAERWRKLRARGLVPRMLRWVDAGAARLSEPQRRNFRRWPVLGKWVWPNALDPYTGLPRKTYRAEVAYLRTWLRQRAAWIDEGLPALQARAERLAGGTRSPTG